MSGVPWFRPRGYRHFDVPVGVAYAAALTPQIVSGHSWSPLIHYTKEEKRYRPLSGKTLTKSRPIMYASHRDACILSMYSYLLCRRLEDWYQETGTSDVAIAYRSLGSANYHLANDVHTFVKSRERVTVMCFDVKGFFDNLHHRLLKERLRWILGLHELPADWYAVFKALTKYHFVELKDLKGVPRFADRISSKGRVPIATMSELKASGVQIFGNSNGFGIPQGTPISASLSNLYMTGFDESLSTHAAESGALYRRYSDDILIACAPDEADEFELEVEMNLRARGLELQKNKTERKTLSANGKLTFQYLGFQLGRGGALIRPASLSRQWRTARRAVRKAERAGAKAIREGRATEVFTRALHTRYNDSRGRNFMSYVSRSAQTLNSYAIKKQAKKLRRFIQNEMRRLKGRSKLP